MTVVFPLQLEKGSKAQRIEVGQDGPNGKEVERGVPPHTRKATKCQADKRRQSQALLQTLIDLQCPTSVMSKVKK
jgi:hypothetical protein